MSLPDYLCPRTIRWLAENQRALADDLAKSAVGVEPNDASDLLLLSSCAHNRAANLNGLAITVENRSKKT